MNGVAVLRSAFSGAHMWYQGTVADITAEQANSVPPGIAHPISSLAHAGEISALKGQMSLKGYPF